MQTLKLQHYRLKNKYSLNELSDKLELDESTLKRYEIGERHIPFDIIKKYCNLFGITPNDLYGIHEPTKKHRIPLYSVLLKNKRPVALLKPENEFLKVSNEQFNKGYDFAIQAWNMENNPKFYNGDILYFKFDKNIINNDVILYLKDEIPYIRIFRKHNDRISLKSFSYKVKIDYLNDIKDIKIIGRLVEIRSFLKKGDNPWPQDR